MALVAEYEMTVENEPYGEENDGYHEVAHTLVVEAIMRFDEL